MKIIVEIKNIYGNQTIYPVCDKAKIFASMVGQKTLTTNNIHHIKQLGYEIELKSHVFKL